MANIAIHAPFEFFVDKTGRPLASGQIFVGLPDQDPEASPQAVYFDAAGSIAAPIPVPTNAAGLPCDASGNPVRLFTAGPYSMLVKDSTGVHVFYVADSADGFYGVTAVDLASQIDPAKGSGMVGYVIQPGATGSSLHDKIARAWVDAQDFGAVGDGVSNDKAAFDAAAAVARSILLPAGDYNVPAGDYSQVRFYSFDGATCNNPTVTIVDPLSNSMPVGSEWNFPCAPSSLPFGFVHEAGQTLNRAVYPQLWAFAETSGNIVDEADKASNKLAFGRGNGSTTFSLPDRRGTVVSAADASAGVDAAFVLGKSVARTVQSGSGSTTTYGVMTPAIRAFATPVNSGNIDIQALQTSVNDLQADVDLKLYIADKRVCTAWVNFCGSPLTGTYSQTGTEIAVTIASHGLIVGQTVRLDFTTGTAVDGSFAVATVTDANSFTVTAAAPLTTSGNVSLDAFIRDSFNVSSITDLGTGSYTVNFLEPLNNNRFSVTVGGKSTDDAANENSTIKPHTFTTGGFGVKGTSGGGANQDQQIVCCQVYGGKA